MHSVIYNLCRKIWRMVPEGNPLKKRIQAWRIRRRLPLSAYIDYPAWRRERREARSALYRPEGGEPLFSINTTVYDTPAEYLRDLQRCIAAQDYPHFEWNVLDNGSRNGQTIEAVREIGRADSRFRTWRVEDNLHIIGGNRFLLERSNNDYILSVDSDDLLDSDALRVFACFIQRLGRPALLYGDEEKTDCRGKPIHPFLRHAPSMLVGYSHCFFAHPFCFDRRRGLEADVYTQDYARGSHDWDTYHRLAARGARMIHIPEVLYGWRMSQSSTAQDIRAKGYAIESQRGVLENSLARRGLGRLFDIVDDERKGLCFWKAIRRRTAPPAVEVLFHARGGDKGRKSFAKLGEAIGEAGFPAEKLRITVVDGAGSWSAGKRGAMPFDVRPAAGRPPHEAINDAVCDSAADLVVVIDEHVYPETASWLWDIVGLFELDDRLAALSGLVVSRGGRVTAMPRYGGLDGHAAMPCLGMRYKNLFRLTGRYALDQNCSAVAMPWVALRREGFRQVGVFARDPLGEGGDVEFCFRAARAGWTTGFTGRVVFRSLAARTNYGPDPSDPFVRQVLADYVDLICDDPFYHPCLSLQAKYFGVMDSAESRQAVLAAALDKHPATRGLVRKETGRTTRYDLRYRLTPRG